MKVTRVNENFVRNHDTKNYNEGAWNKQVDRILKYEGVEFYIAEKDDIYDYDRFFVEYTLPEDLRLWKDFGYGGGITNGGFYRLDKDPVTEDGKTYADTDPKAALELQGELDNADTFDVRYGYFNMDGEKALFGTSKEARREMARRSKEYDMVFTKG
jgi:hypothetical protein